MRRGDEVEGEVGEEEEGGKMKGGLEERIIKLYYCYW